MKHTTKVTSKGTITIPSSIRKQFGIEQGRRIKVSVSSDNKIVLDPGITREQFEEARERLVASISPKKLGLSGRALKDAIDRARVEEYKRKYKK